MKNKHILLLTMIISCMMISCKMINYKKERHKSIKIEWTKNLKGDFSFKEKWSYQEGIYKNQFGQLSCDGNCPIEIDGMKDEFGKINKDSLQSFYKMIDTTHVFHSLYSNNRMYEYSGTNFIEFEKLENGIIRGKSTNNASTHSNLVLELKNNLCSAFVELNSIRNLGKNKFPLKSGNIKIDKNLFEKGIVKAKFHFKFKNVIEPDKELFWNGMIYSKINNKHTKQVHKQ